MNKRELTNELRAHRAGLIERKEEIDTELEGIEAALAALDNRPIVGRTRRVEPGARLEQTLAALREHPEQQFTPNDLADATGMQQSTAATVMRRLIARGEVERAGKTKRGGPIIKHKPTVIDRPTVVSTDNAPVYEDVTP